MNKWVQQTPRFVPGEKGSREKSRKVALKCPFPAPLACLGGSSTYMLITLRFSLQCHISQHTVFWRCHAHLLNIWVLWLSWITIHRSTILVCPACFSKRHAWVFQSLWTLKPFTGEKQQTCLSHIDCMQLGVLCPKSCQNEQVQHVQENTMKFLRSGIFLITYSTIYVP